MVCHRCRSATDKSSLQMRDVSASSAASSTRVKGRWTAALFCLRSNARKCKKPEAGLLSVRAFGSCAPLPTAPPLPKGLHG
eukprot:809506-Prorocentrum_lima.AAC.1